MSVQRCGYPAYFTAAFLSRYLPLWISYRLSMAVAGLARRCAVGQREAIERNLLRIMEFRGEDGGKEAVRRRILLTYRSFGRYMVDFFRYSVSARHGIESRVEVVGEEHLRGALAAGRGALLATAHLGNWELGGLVLALRGYPLTAAYRPMRSPRVNRLFLNQRRRRGMQPVPLGRAARDLLRALRKGRVAALLADRDFSGEPTPTLFFGAPAPLPRGPVTLSRRTGAPLVPAFMLRLPDDRFRLLFLPALQPDAFASMDAMQNALARALESVIGEYPEQWFLFDDFWPRPHHSGASDRRPTAPDGRAEIQ